MIFDQVSLVSCINVLYISPQQLYSYTIIYKCVLDKSAKYWQLIIWGGVKQVDSEAMAYHTGLIDTAHLIQNELFWQGKLVSFFKTT